MAFQTPFCFVDTKTNDCNFFKVNHDPRQKLTHVGFSNSQNPLVVVSYESRHIFEKL